MQTTVLFNVFQAYTACGHPLTLYSTTTASPFIYSLPITTVSSSASISYSTTAESNQNSYNIGTRSSSVGKLSKDAACVDSLNTNLRVDSTTLSTSGDEVQQQRSFADDSLEREGDNDEIIALVAARVESSRVRTSVVRQLNRSFSPSNSECNNTDKSSDHPLEAGEEEEDLTPISLLEASAAVAAARRPVLNKRASCGSVLSRNGTSASEKLEKSSSYIVTTEPSDTSSAMKYEKFYVPYAGSLMPKPTTVVTQFSRTDHVTTTFAANGTSTAQLNTCYVPFATDDLPVQERHSYFENIRYSKSIDRKSSTLPNTRTISESDNEKMVTASAESMKNTASTLTSGDINSNNSSVPPLIQVHGVPINANSASRSMLISQKQLSLETVDTGINKDMVIAPIDHEDNIGNEVLPDTSMQCSEAPHASLQSPTTCTISIVSVSTTATTLEGRNLLNVDTPTKVSTGSLSRNASSLTVEYDSARESDVEESFANRKIYYVPFTGDVPTALQHMLHTSTVSSITKCTSSLSQPLLYNGSNTDGGNIPLSQAHNDGIKIPFVASDEETAKKLGKDINYVPCASKELVFIKTFPGSSQLSSSAPDISVTMSGDIPVITVSSESVEKKFNESLHMPSTQKSGLRQESREREISKSLNVGLGVPVSTSDNEVMSTSRESFSSETYSKEIHYVPFAKEDLGRIMIEEKRAEQMNTIINQQPLLKRKRFAAQSAAQSRSLPATPSKPDLSDVNYVPYARSDWEKIRLSELQNKRRTLPSNITSIPTSDIIASSSITSSSEQYLSNFVSSIVCRE